MISGRPARYCVPCRAKTRRAYRQRHPESMRNYDYRKQIRDEVPDFVDGYAMVSSTWVRENIAKIGEYVQQGVLVVEYHGTPVFEIRHWETA